MASQRNEQFQRQINRAVQALAKLQAGLDTDKWTDAEQANAAEEVTTMTAQIEKLTNRITL